MWGRQRRRRTRHSMRCVAHGDGWVPFARPWGRQPCAATACLRLAGAPVPPPDAVFTAQQIPHMPLPIPSITADRRWRRCCSGCRACDSCWRRCHAARASRCACSLGTRPARRCSELAGLFGCLWLGAASAARFCLAPSEGHAAPTPARHPAPLSAPSSRAMLAHVPSSYPGAPRQSHPRASLHAAPPGFAAAGRRLAGRHGM